LANLPVSVLIDTYNHERFIEKAIVSVLEQDFPAAQREIIVIDDGSTDGTPEIVRRFEPQVRYIRKNNGGQASAFNAGIPECRGEIIAFLDGDDYWLPGKLSRVMDVFANNPAVGLVGHAIKETLPDGSERISAPEKDERFRMDSLAAARVFRLRRSYLGTSRMSVRAEVARRILPVPDALVIEADEYIFTMAAAMSETVVLHEPLTCYVIHGNNLYVSAGFGTEALRRKMQVIVALAKALRAALPQTAIAPDALRCVLEVVQAEADQLRLMVDGGFSWETFRAENKMFAVHHGDAPFLQRAYRAISMIPALLLPPKWFYWGRHWLGSRAWYRDMRKEKLPVPQMTRVAGPEEFKI
jgi:hypothetical protein